MKFVCLGYFIEDKWQTLSKKWQDAFTADCLAYDAELKRKAVFLEGGLFLGEEHMVTLRFHSEKVLIADGPLDEKSAELRYLLFLEARDLNHAISLIAKHPRMRAGAFEVRPVEKSLIGYTG